MTAPETTMTELFSEDDLRKFIGKKTDYYLKAWAKKGMSTNVGAFFMGIGWLAYRKMYVETLIMFAVIMVSVAADFIWKIPDSFDRAITFGLAATMGVCGNLFYKGHVERKLRQIKAQGLNPDLESEAIVRAGGVSWLNGIGAITITIAVIILAVFMFTPDTFTIDDLQDSVKSTIVENWKADPAHKEVVVTKVELKESGANEDSTILYSGTVSFTQDGKTMVTPINVTAKRREFEVNFPK